MSQDQKPGGTLEDGRRLLAGLEADIQRGEAQLRRSTEEGHAHFQAGMEDAHGHLEDANLDGWSLQAAAQARVAATAPRRKPTA